MGLATTESNVRTLTGLTMEVMVVQVVPWYVHHPEIFVVAVLHGNPFESVT
jgi:hypothetical protein